MVKILMVHGFGTNANIFAAQTAPIRALLPSHWEYHFIEGTVECGPAPGVATVYPNQNYKGWHTVPSQKFIEASYGYLEEAIEDEGPFYAAWGFSQGANMIGSFLLQHAHEHPHTLPPFRSAIFMNGYMAYSAIPELGIDVTPLIITHQHVPCTLAETQSALDRTNAQNPSQEAMLADARNGAWKEGKLIPEFVKKAFQGGVDSEAANGVKRSKWEDFKTRRMFVEVDPEVRIRIPTAHLVADKDEVRAEGETLAKMCEEKTRLVYKSSGGHGVPKLDRDVGKVSEVIERTVERAGFAWSSM